jgi:ATP-dependent RNA helicase DeaD
LPPTVLERLKKKAKQSSDATPASRPPRKPQSASALEPLNRGKVHADLKADMAKSASTVAPKRRVETVEKAIVQTQMPAPDGMTFADMAISLELKQSLAFMGYTAPSPIQAKAIPVMLTSQDVIGQAQTGTGKTAAFAIPTINQVNPSVRYSQVLVVCPTRELAVQVANQYKKLLKYLPDIHVVAVYGGEPINKQFKLLRKNPQIIVGTPGRLIDHMKRETLDLSTVRTVVLDEADEMLNMGFKVPIETLLQAIPKPRQVVFFSATMPRPMQQLMQTYMQQPVMVEVPVEKTVSALIEQYYVDVQPRHKQHTLMRLMSQYQVSLSLVFCNTQRQVDTLVKQLQTDGYEVEGIHGGLPQAKRDRVMARFRQGKITCLVATDVAARGIDVSQIDAVFNYDFPHDMAYYTHRIGRTGRAGQTGRAFTFVEPRQAGALRQLRKQPDFVIQRLTVE